MDNVKQVVYNQDNNIMTVTYSGGSIWDYHPINPETFTQVMAADSLARAVHQVLRAGNAVGIKRLN